MDTVRFGRYSLQCAGIGLLGVIICAAGGG